MGAISMPLQVSDAGWTSGKMFTPLRARFLPLAMPLLGIIVLANCGGSAGGTIPVPATSNPPPVGPIALSVISANPSSGPSSGGTMVTISGKGFDAGASVNMGLISVAPISVINLTIEVITPAQVPGTMPIIVTNPNEDSFTLGRGFTYEPGPSDNLLFRDVTAEAGLNFVHSRDSDVVPIGAGAGVGDFNGDRWPDFFLTNNVGDNALYVNQQDGTFMDLALQAGVSLTSSDDVGVCVADYDNDGDVDIYVSSFGSNHLLRNLGFGTFEEVTDLAGVGDDGRGTSCAWGDFDSDGLLDLYVTNYSLEEEEAHPGVLYHNEGDGTFTDFTSVLDTQSIRVAGLGVSWFDYDNDSDLDLYLVNDFGATIHSNVLFRNDGPQPGVQWKFTDVSTEAGVDIEQFGMGLAVGDYDGDGWLDMYATDIGRNELLRNRGDGTFEDATDRARVGRSMLPETGFHNVGWGAAFIDFDNDGHLDLYAVAGHLDVEGVGIGQEFQPNALFHNNGDGTFEDVSQGSGADSAQVGRGGVYLDYDRDGDLDLLVANLGESPALLRNENNSGNSWISLRLVGGPRSNTNGIGTRITLGTGSALQIRELGSGSSVHSNHTFIIHFGLGTVETINRIEIRWPSGQKQTLLDVLARQELTIVEP